MSLSNRFQEAHFCNLQTQSNVYGLAKITMPCGMHKILVASYGGKVVSMEFQKTRPLSKEVHFTYIPGDAEIVSIDAFTKTDYGSGVVVGITFVKRNETKPCQYLNIYSEWEPEAEFNLDSIAQGCQNLELTFIPYQLYHTQIPHSGNIETVFLLSGSDQKIHIFREDRYTHTFHEEAAEDFFPEFTDLPSNVTWMHCLTFDDYRRRISAVGDHCGHIRLALVDTESKDLISPPDLLQMWTVQHDSPITYLQTFPLETDVECPSFASQVLDTLDEGAETDCQEINLLVTSAIEPAVVYRNVLEKGLSEPIVLSDSDRFDSVLCATVADIDFDGQNEILLGTYGQEMLTYKFQQRSGNNKIENSSQPWRSNNQKPEETAECSDTTGVGLQRRPSDHRSEDHSEHFSDCQVSGQLPTDNQKAEDQTEEYSDCANPSQQRTIKQQTEEACTDSLNSVELLTDHQKSEEETDEANDSTVLSPRTVQTCKCGEFRLIWQRSFADPLLALDSVDVTGDGVNEIVAVSLKGLHVLQHDLAEVAKLCVERMKLATEQQSGQEDVFKQLLSENLSSS